MRSEITKVNLEILRHGPAHNQPLSPLTNYLALCGNHGATSVRVPFEHREFETRLRPLMYQESEQLRQQQLQHTAAEMRDILQGIPGLIAALAEAAGRSRAELNKQRLVHMELILSASELALLPFELATAPAGCPGTGEPLITQSQLPLCMTRRVRLQNLPEAAWNRRPRILFAAAAPDGVIPIEEHCEAFLAAVDGWIDWSQVNRSNVVQVYGDHITVLPQASLQQIEEELARVLEKESDRPYTHVHLLAHGVPVEEAGERRFGLAMHHPSDPKVASIVRAQELAVALRAASPHGSTDFSCPTVVTLASCQGAAQGDVLGAGASIAHTLHEAGIPLVVASQFPLTFPGSVQLVRILYRGFFRGHDPRILLTQLRRQLRITPEARHDWASIVAYAGFSPRMETELADLRYRQARRSVELALDGFDRQMARSLVTHLSRDSKGSDAVAVGRFTPDQAQLRRFRDLTRWLESASQRLGRIAQERAVEGHLSLHGLMAATTKKLAQWQWREGRLSQGSETGVRRDSEEPQAVQPFMASLHRACRLYRRASREMPTANWARTQELCLRIVLGCVTAAQAKRLWIKAWLGVKWELMSSERDDRLTRIIAFRNAVELQLLALLVPQPSSRRLGSRKQKPQITLIKLLKRFCSLAGTSHMEFRSFKQQLERYCDFYPEVACRSHDGSDFKVTELLWKAVSRAARRAIRIMDSFRPACDSPTDCSCDDREISY